MVFEEARLLVLGIRRERQPMVELNVVDFWVAVDDVGGHRAKEMVSEGIARCQVQHSSRQANKETGSKAKRNPFL